MKISATIITYNEERNISRVIESLRCADEVVVIDKGSSNGTYVNSVESPKVSKIGLRNGDRIFLGKKGGNVFTYFNS